MEKRVMAIVAAVFVVAMLAAFYAFSTCSFSCAMKGYPNAECKTAPVIPGAHPCDESETDIGETADCTPGSLIGAMYHCCCS